ncbi:MAG: 4Fe-4S dicluster domain-containing protein [Deltaproteobacteria bacterium]|jgi:Fe-S-cluster-containing hydrogenase component 2|nr:4Fe-4S dicluster domain-containing protein [Deltaproteobacteria bacterium]
MPAPPKAISATPSRCIGCLTCELACASRGWQETYPYPARISLVFFRDGAKIPLTCFQCDNAPCLSVCRTGSLTRDGLGVVASDPAKCIGCRACSAVCPFGNIVYSPAVRAAVKCDQCGGEPRCAAACPSGALRYVDAAADVKAKREAFARTLKAAAEAL